MTLASAATVRGDDRPAGALGRARREARLHGPAELRRPALHRGPRRPRRRRRRDRRRRDRRPRLRPPRHALRPARDPRRGRPAGPPPRRRDRRVRGAARRRLRRRPGACRPTPSRRTRRSSAPSARSSTPARSRSILGGDHSIAEPDIRAVAARHGPVGLVHFDAHADTATHRLRRRRARTARRCAGSSRTASSTRSATCRSACAATGRASSEFAWQREQGITSLFMHDVVALGIEEVGRPRDRRSSAAGPVFLSIDIDVLDPSVAPGTGTPEPGGMGAADLLWAVRALAQRARRRRRRARRGDPDASARPTSRRCSPTASCARC